ncbi:MAG: hypothetical protein U9N87_08125 [Planctomycetota bacterium]|nr:hypothetical protein [Planctomycetota bacterium]
MNQSFATHKQPLRIGAAATEIEADDSMVIAGGIFPAFACGQEGLLRASAIVLQKHKKVCLISCDVIMLQRDILDDACRQIEAATGIAAENILISSTHTHHAPSTATVHGYEREELFCDRVKEAIVASAKTANSKLEEAGCYFACEKQNSVGRNSRVKLDDGTILWVPLEEQYAALEPTGHFDADFPLLSFKTNGGKQLATVFNHSCHNIGSRDGNKRSPGFYGLAAQELEKELAAPVIFFSGAAGSTHDMKLTADELIDNIKGSIRDASRSAVEKEAYRIESVKTEFEYRVRSFNERQEDRAVAYYCHKRRVDWCEKPEEMVEVFRDMRRVLAEHQGEIRKSWLQVILIDDIALVAVPGEFFGKLAAEIKSRSPLPNTHIIGYANDHIGYIPDSKAYDLGGYQTWTGFHSLVERGTGEMIVEKVLSLLNSFGSTADAS